MAIIGGAIFPPVMGLVAVRTGAISPALLLPATCFAIIAVYARRTSRA
jgi:FHS family L-fucose permease-like MFS transporter